jgi:hypothetical protein
MDEGSLSSEFSKLSTYVYATHLFTFKVDRVANLMTKGLNYRFKFRSENVIGFSQFSDSTRVALGPLPDKPASPYRAILGNSPTSIGVDWVAIPLQTLEVLQYRLYMDDGNGVIFKKIYQGINFNFVALNLTSGIAYSFKISAVNFNGEGVMSDPAVITSCIVPSGVMAPKLVISTYNSVSLRWSQPLSNGGCSVTSYAVFRDNGDNGDFSFNMEPLVIGNNPYLFDHVFVLPA